MNIIDKLDQLGKKMTKSADEYETLREIKKRVIVQLIMNEVADIHATEQTMEFLDRYTLGFHVDSDLHKIIDKAVRLTLEEVVDLLSPYNSYWPDGLKTEDLLDVLRRRSKKFSVWVLKSHDIADIVGSIDRKLSNLFKGMKVKVNWDLDIRAVEDFDNTCRTELKPTIHIDVSPFCNN